MKTKSHRRWRPGCVTPLEGRTLLSAALPTATWIGQDGVDRVGRASTPGPDGVQDIDVALAGLPTNVSIVRADIIGYGGGEWEYNGPPGGPWAAALVQAQTAAPSGRKPNILVIWGDDIGQSNISAYTFGLMGYKTPNIDRIAREGMMFTDYYA